MTIKSSLLKIKECLTDEEILGLHLEGCPHVEVNGETEILGDCNHIDKDCNECWLESIKLLK